MSLLMDALRRAEADKKAQEERAARAAGNDATNTGGPITRVSSYNNAKDDTVQIDGRALQAAASSIADFDLRIDDNLDRSLSMTQPEGLSLEPMGAAAVAGDATNFAAINRVVADDDLDFPGNLTFAGRIDRRDRIAATATEPDFSDEDDDYFDRSYGAASLRDTPPADSTLEQVSAHTIAGAQTVFRAGERPRSGRLLTLAAAIAIFVVLGTAGLGVYYAGINPTPRVMPSPEVARGVEKMAPLPPLPTPPAMTDTAAPANNVVPDAPVSSATDQRVDPTSAERPAAPEQAAPALDAVPALAKREPRAANRALLNQRTRAALPGASPPTDEEINSGEVRISRSHTSNNIDASISQAYAAFQNGDFVAAARLYETARIADPGRRDTLLGLAAVALKRGDLPRAYDYYAQVLKAQPRDPVASAALFSLTEADGESGAARLRLLLDAQGDAPYIHAALGSWYARRARWADAQQAYFDAARLDSSNPDYSFNLAVSLEHMGQASTALGYYQKSLSLRAQHGAGFDVTTAQDRIRALSAPGTP
jgi:tetratricopeptide (TPR) repeat protein